MRFGAPVDGYDTPTEWVSMLDDHGYAAAYCPVDVGADPETIQAYAAAAEDADVMIAEVNGFGPNPLSPDPDERRDAIEACKRSLELADAIGANCCVNIAGSRNPDQWDGPHPENFSGETFDRIVDSVREIIDAVDPDRASYTLEPMPWVPPDSIESHRRLLDTIDREAFGIHLDIVNMLCSPRRFSDHVAFVEEFVDAFGSSIQCCHLKDARLAGELTVHIEEAAPGTGDLDLADMLRALDGIDDLPVLLEHLPGQEAYDRAAEHVRTVADGARVQL